MASAEAVKPTSHDPQMDSSRKCQKLFVVRTPRHEKTSATRMAGKISFEKVTILSSLAGRAKVSSKFAHCATKHSSAIVATFHMCFLFGLTLASQDEKYRCELAFRYERIRAGQRFVLSPDDLLTNTF